MKRCLQRNSPRLTQNGILCGIGWKWSYHVERVGSIRTRPSGKNPKHPTGGAPAEIRSLSRDKRRGSSFDTKARRQPLDSVISGSSIGRHSLKSGRSAGGSPVGNGETLIGAEAVHLKTASNTSQSCGVGASDGGSNSPGMVRPAPDNSGPHSESQPRRARKRPAEATENITSVEKEDWLPPGWTVVDKVRSSGASAGSRDKYFIEPNTGRRFRSKKEVQYYLETGQVRKRPKKNPENSPEKGVKSPPVNFNFEDVPDTVKWVRTGASEAWTPFIDGEEIPESSKLDWAAAFEFLALKSSWRPTF